MIKRGEVKEERGNVKWRMRNTWSKEYTSAITLCVPANHVFSKGSHFLYLHNYNDNNKEILTCITIIIHDYTNNSFDNNETKSQRKMQKSINVIKKD